MRTVHKYAFDASDSLGIMMPKGADLLTVQTQGSDVCVWAMVETAAPLVRRGLALRGTGHNCQDIPSSAYVGTFQIHGGALVFHLFDLGES